MKKITVIHETGFEQNCEITSYMHCSLCLQEKPEDVSPAEWARLNVGMTPKGIQVWCVRHDSNVDHMQLRLRTE